MFKCIRPAAVAAILLFFISNFTIAQQSSPVTTPAQVESKPAASHPATELKINTRLVTVDVVATDSKGAPVTDLQAVDFAVQEDGKEQSVKVFSFHQPDQPADSSTAPAAAPTPKLPDGHFTNSPKYKTNGALNVILLDSLNSTLPDQAAMHDAMIKFLDKLPEGQPIAIYLMGKDLTLIQDFTSDPELLHKAISGMKRQGSSAVANAAGTTRMADMPVGSAAWYTMAVDMPKVQGALENFRDQQAATQGDFRVRFSLDVLESLARSLAGYPGRKNLVWISETFPFTIRTDKTTMGEASLSGTVATETANANNRRDFSREIAAAGNLLSNAQVAIYPVDVRALGGNTEFSVGNDPNPIGNPAILSTTLDFDAGKNMNHESEDRMASHSTMNDLAEKTGGKAFYNTNNLEGAVRRSLEDGSTYYTLGYYPENKSWDGKFRRIAVKAVRPGIKLHYRLGYFATEPQAYAKLDQEQKHDDLAKAMSLAFPVSTALLFQAMVVQPTAEDRKVQIHYAVDPHALAFNLGGDGLQHINVDCAVIVYSQKGEAVQALSNTMVASLKPEEYKRVMQQSFPCRQSLELPPGEYLFRLGVRDASTGLVGTLNAPVTVAQPAAGSEAKPAEKP